MSTLAAARADNFYISKNYDPSKVKAKKSDTAEEKPFKVVEGERVGGSKVRYETPFHVRCEGCHNMVAKGVRFNSIKTWVDNFHTTKIYEFRMKCPQCVQRFVVRTDPQNCDYVYVSGAKRIFQAKDCTDQSRIRDEQQQQKIKQNPFAKLENAYRDKLQYTNAQASIEQLMQMQQRGVQDFMLNKQLRKQARGLREQQAKYYQEKHARNLCMPLLSQRYEDEQEAERIHFKNNKSKQIKKQDKLQSEREITKEKMKRLHPDFKKILKKQIVAMNRPTTSVFVKK